MTDHPRPARRERPGAAGLPYRVVAEVLTGITDDWGPPGVGRPSDTTSRLVDAGLVETSLAALPGDAAGLWRGRRTRRGREWVSRHVRTS